MSVAGILTNTYIPNGNGKVYNVDAIDEMLDGISGEIEEAIEGVEEKIEEVEGEIAKVDARVTAVDSRVDHLESLGQITKPGVFANLTARPDNTSGFTIAPTVNDFCFIKTDSTQAGKTSIYIISAIDDGESGGTAGAITWEFLKAFDTDMTGKMDVVSNAENDAVAVFDSVTGNVKVFVDSNSNQLKIADLMWEFEALNP